LGGDHRIVITVEFSSLGSILRISGVARDCVAFKLEIKAIKKIGEIIVRRGVYERKQYSSL